MIHLYHVALVKIHFFFSWCWSMLVEIATIIVAVVVTIAGMAAVIMATPLLMIGLGLMLWAFLLRRRRA